MIKKIHISQQDKELAEAAKKKAWGVRKLAQMLEVSTVTASVWGRKKPIPRHLLFKLEEFVSGPNAPELTLHDLVDLIGQRLDGVSALGELSPEIKEKYLQHIDFLKRIIRRLVFEVESYREDLKARAHGKPFDLDDLRKHWRRPGRPRRP